MRCYFPFTLSRVRRKIRLVNVLTYRDESYFETYTVTFHILKKCQYWTLDLLLWEENDGDTHDTQVVGRLWEGVLSLIITMAWTSMFVYVARQHLQVDGPKHLSQ